MIKVEFSDDKSMMGKEVFYQVSGASQITREFFEQKNIGEVGSRQLYAYAKNLNRGDTVIEDQLKSNPNLRAALRKIIKNLSQYHLPEAMAASTEELQDRIGKDCHIRFEESRAVPDQFDVFVEMVKDKSAIPSCLIVCDEDLNCHQFDLPAMRQGVSQLISDRNSELLVLLSNPKSEVFLR